MISFGPTEEQQMAREAMREFAEQVIRPLARDCDETSAVPESFLKQAWELGLVDTQIPVALGGGGEVRSPLTHALVLEELAWGDATLALAAMTPAQFVLPLLEMGTPEQQRRYLPLFTTGKPHVASLAWIEEGACFDPLKLRTLAEPKGDGFVLTGSKRLVPLGERASHFLVLARNTAGEGFAALEAFVVPRDAAGLVVSEPEKLLGLRALGATRLQLQRVEVAAQDRLGGAAGVDARRLLNLSRTALAATLLGVSRAVMDYAIPYAKDRVAFGEAIARKQAIAFTLSNMRIETDAMRWLVWKAASQLEQGVDATRSAELARSYAARQSMKISDDGVQVLGGHGFIREHPVELWYRNARTLGVLEGTAVI